MRIAVISIVAAAMVLVFALQMTNGINPDVSWLITVSERMLSGQKLYVEIQELNPPMSALMYLPFVALAKFFGVPPEPIIILVILLLILLCLQVSTTILQKAGLLTNYSRWWVISIVAFVVSPGASFGEREHIAVILLLPLLAVSAARSVNKAPNLGCLAIAGLTAGLVMTIKPHFALPILFVALYGSWSAHSWRPTFNTEHVLAGLILVGYWLAVCLWFPSFFDTLKISSVVYVSDRAPMWSLLINLPLLPIWLMIGGLLLIYPGESRSVPLSQYIIAAAGFLLVYLVQGKGFLYHFLPTQMLLTVAFVEAFFLKNLRNNIRVFPLVLAVAFIAAPSVLGSQTKPLRKETLAVLAPLGSGLKFANLTTHLELISPLHRDLGGSLVTSMPFMWMTLGAIRRQTSTDDPAIILQMKYIETIERSRLRDELLRNPPDIILAGADRFDWVAWARQDSLLDALFDDYYLFASVGPEIAPLKIFRRRESWILPEQN